MKQQKSRQLHTGTRTVIQINGIKLKSPEANPSVHGQLIFSRAAKTLWWRKGTSVQQMVMIQLVDHIQKNELDSYLIPFVKFNSEWINNINVKAIL